MGDAAQSFLTYEDLLPLDRDVRAEVLGGALVTTPAPLPRHSKAQRAIGSFVGRPYDDDDGHGGPGGWWIFIEVDVQLGAHDIVRPDLSGWRRERLIDPGMKRPIEVPPDWVCEISSPSTVRFDRGIKRSLYHEHGVAHYWLVDPEARLIEVFERQNQGWHLLGTYTEQDSVALPPFTEIELPIGRLFLPESSS